VPIVAAVVLVGLPWFAFSPILKPLLSGIFDPVDERALSLITAVALFNAWTIALTSRLILAYGAERLGLPRRTDTFLPVPLWVWAASASLAIPVVWRSVQYSHEASGRHRLQMVAFVAMGAAVAVALLFASVKASAYAISQRRRQESVATLPAGLLASLLRALADTPWLTAGFFEAASDPLGPPRLRPGHCVAAFLAVSSLLLYVIVGWLTGDIARPILASTLVFVLLLTLVLTWSLAFASFVLDRSRVPLLVYFLGWLVIVETVIDPAFPTDHVYRTVPVNAQLSPATPTDVLRNSSHPIIVAAAGGGIQAAAWTSRVLTALGEVSGFNANLRFVSAVSGGSVGTMNVLASFAECGPPLRRPQSMASFEPNSASQESSLHAIGWGLVFKDLPRTILPFFSDSAVDRGSVLEDAWKREPRLSALYPDPSPWLTNWRRNVGSGTCPGVVFNATAAETGEPVLFSTVALPESLEPFDFHKRYVGRDVSMVTAVRLSAGFPYVSSAARADVDEAGGRYLHVVDGGYLDVYGVNTLANWTHAALVSRPADTPTRRLLILEVCDTVVCSSHESSGTLAGGDRKGWPYQLVAPLSGFLATWGTGQRSNNRTSLRLLKEFWRAKGVCVESLEVPYNPKAVPPPSAYEAEGPLSWHLTGAEKRAIETEWRRIAAATTSTVSSYLAAESFDDEGRLLPCADR
jgi:hypothetical protein